MTDKQLLDHYRNLYQVAKRDKDIWSIRNETTFEIK